MTILDLAHNLTPAHNAATAIQWHSQGQAAAWVRIIEARRAGR